MALNATCCATGSSSRCWRCCCHRTGKPSSSLDCLEGSTCGIRTAIKRNPRREHRRVAKHRCTAFWCILLSPEAWRKLLGFVKVDKRQSEKYKIIRVSLLYIVPCPPIKSIILIVLIMFVSGVNIYCVFPLDYNIIKFIFHTCIIMLSRSAVIYHILTSKEQVITAN